MSRLSTLKEFADFLSFSFRARRLILLAIVVSSAIPGALYWHMPGILRYAFMLGYVWLIVLGIWSQGGFLLRLARTTILSIVLARKYKLIPYSTPAVDELASKMGVLGKVKVYITPNPHVQSAFTNALTGHVHIPEAWMKLPESEIMAILGHEFSHIKRRGRFMLEGLIAVLAGYGLATILSLLTVLLVLVFEVAELATAYLAISFVSWRNENRADKDGAAATGPEGLISVFELFESRLGKVEGSETHPPLSSRIKRLLKMLDEPDSNQKGS